MIRRNILLLACLVLTISSGVLRGRVDYRWGVSEDFLMAAERVRAIPKQLGEWEAEKMERLDEQAQSMLRVSGDVFARYATPTGEHVSMTFLVGPAGPLAIHTAEVCYGSANYTIQGGVQRETIIDDAGTEHQFAVVVFRENRVGNRPLKVYYAWNKGDRWIAPVSPRTEFAGTPMLYKIQIATADVGADDNTHVDSAAKFLKQNLPKLNQICELRAGKVITD